MTQILESNKFGKVQMDDINEFEITNDIVLPVDYKEFLIMHNGGKPSLNIEPTVNSDVQWIYGLVEQPYYASIFQPIDMFKNRIPSWYMPIANDSGGNLYIMSLFKDNYGLIAFWRHEEETKGSADQYFDNMDIVATSFTGFLTQLVST